MLHESNEGVFARSCLWLGGGGGRRGATSSRRNAARRPRGLIGGLFDAPPQKRVLFLCCVALFEGGRLFDKYQTTPFGFVLWIDGDV